MVTVMLRSILGLLALLGMLAGQASAQSLQITTDKRSYKLGDAIDVVVTVEGPSQGGFDGVLETSLLSDNPMAPVPRNVVEAVELKAGGRKRVELSFPTQWLVYGGNYEIRVVLVDEKMSVVATADQSVVVEGGVKPWDIVIATCVDPGCKERTRVFSRGQEVHVDVIGKSADTVLEGLLTAPSGKSVSVSLPDTFVVEEPGDYSLRVRAERPGYEPLSRTVPFAVLERESEVPR